jgi:hypothetical protein
VVVVKQQIQRAYLTLPLPKQVQNLTGILRANRPLKL